MQKFVIFFTAFGSLLYLAVYAGARTSQFGYSVSLLIAAVVCSVAALVIGSTALNVKSRTITLVPFMFVIVATLVVELFAGSQEFLVRRQYGEVCEKNVYVSRWVPFTNHALYCGDDGNWVGND